MTTQKTFKRRVRDRMAKTGESYTAARRQLIAAGDQPDPGTPTYETVVSDDRMLEATGKRHEAWFKIFDRWGAKERTHTEIASHVIEELGVEGWWGQSITVSYERARGMRAVGQMKDGWTITASKTVSVPVDDLFDAVVEERVRKEWLPDADVVAPHGHQAQVGSLRLGGRQHPGSSSASSPRVPARRRCSSATNGCPTPTPLTP